MAIFWYSLHQRAAHGQLSLRLYTVPLGQYLGTHCISETSLRLYPVPPVSEREVITYCEQHWLRLASESTQSHLSNILVLDASASGKLKTKPVFPHKASELVQIELK